MAPTPVLNASFTSSPGLSPLYPPQATISPFGGFNQNQWGPDAIGTIFFGIAMFLIGVTALWQGGRGRTRHKEDEEQGQRTPVRSRSAAHRVNEVAMVDLSAGEGLGSGGRIAVGMMMDERERNRNRGDDVVDEEGGFVKIGRGTRTGTEATLVGCDDDDDDEVEVEGKGLDD